MLSAILAETEASLLREIYSQRRLVFTNGCFDLIHVGHVRYLTSAKQLGEILVVGLNSDASVRRLKGEGRPLNSEADRAEVLAALKPVDHVVIFNETRVDSLVTGLRPDIYVKGGDYTIDTLDRSEVAALSAAGAEIKILPLVPGRSTTRLIEAMQKR
jgi:D-glycero-beta-D-manno-heptose 1-phosphate adenylyltransferase